LLIIGTAALAIGRGLDDFTSVPWLLTLIIFAAMGYHLVQFERGRGQAGTDFAVTLSGSLYFGWLGAYLVSLRQLPDGFWWLLLTLGCVWIGDSGAYFIGKNFGKHRMSPRLSPKKSWEGYFAELVTGALGGLLLAWLFGYFSWTSAAMQPWHGMVLGLVLAVFTPLGDLGESMIKRQVGVKDSSNLLPGHGGAWDRIDSWLWAAPLGYYLITLLFLRFG
jgi:phosphatidate cytidylyltransferase